MAAAVGDAGDRLGQCQSIPARQGFPSYTQTDLQAATKGESWKAAVFMDNPADIRGILNGVPADLHNPRAFIYLQPRTIGLTSVKTF
jgi:hypothetical protein